MARRPGRVAVTALAALALLCTGLLTTPIGLSQTEQFRVQAESVTGVTHAVFAALSDKDVEGVVAALQQDVAYWHLAGLQDVGARGQDVDALAARLAASAAASGSRHTSVAAALQAVRSAAEPGDRILVLGSFHTAAEAIRFLRSGG